MKKIFLLILGIIFLISFVSAWELVANTPTGSFQGGDPYAVPQGVLVRLRNITNNFIVVKSAATTATTCSLYFQNKTWIVNGTFSGANCSLNSGSSLSVGTTLWVVVQNNTGGLWTDYIYPPNYPWNTTTLEWINSTSSSLFLEPSGYVHPAIFRIWANASAEVPLSCSNISVSGNYSLSGNLTSTGTCFNITANDVSLNLSGYYITGDGTGYGVVTYGNNTKVGNGTISSFNWGIYSQNVHNSSFKNLTVTNSTQYGIVLYPSKNSEIVSNNLSNNGREGATAVDAENITIKDNIVNNNRRHGLSILIVSGAPKNISMTNNTIINSTGDGILVQGTDNTFSNNIIYNASTGSAFDVVGAYGNVYSGNNVTLTFYDCFRIENSTNQTIFNNSCFNLETGIYLLKSNNSNISYNNVSYVHPYDGILFDTLSINNVVHNNKVINTTRMGILTRHNLGNNSFYLNAIQNSSQNTTVTFDAIAITNASNNIFSKNSIDLTGTEGVSIKSGIRLEVGTSSDQTKNNILFDMNMTGINSTDRGVSVLSFSSPDGSIDNNTLLNVSYDGIDYYSGFTIPANFTRQWYVNINVREGEGFCYQESANTTNQTGIDGSCGLNYSGSYEASQYWNSPENSYDGDWNTWGGGNFSSYNSVLYINYTKPSGALSSSLWVASVLDSYPLVVNRSIPTSCWNYDAEKLIFEITQDYISFGPNFDTNLNCFNGTHWLEVGYYNWYQGIYEDAMWWVALGSVVSDANVTIKNISSEIIYTALTNSTGSISRQNVSEYLNTGTKVFATPHTVVVSKTGYSTNTSTINLSATQNINYVVILTAGTAEVNYSVALPLGIIRFLNCSPDWENIDSRPDGQTDVIAAINATNNGTIAGNFVINLTGNLNTGWTLFASNDSLANNLTLSTTAQTIWSNVAAGETKKIWLKANCSYISSNPGQSINIQAS